MLARTQHVQAYKPQADLARLAAAYGFGIIRGQAFNDGNKRAGFLAIGLFLALNGSILSIDQTEAVETILSVADGRLSESQLAGWIRSHTKRQRQFKRALPGYQRLPPCSLCPPWLKTLCKSSVTPRSSDRTGKPPPSRPLKASENKGKRP